jgi:hypothetical protein
MREMADERGMTVGALEARLKLKRGDVRAAVKENGVEDRGGWSSWEVAAGGRGLVERRPNSRSSAVPVAERLRLSWSVIISPVLVVLRFVSGLRPTTVP